MAQKRILILFYSYSSQTRNLLNGLRSRLEGDEVEVVVEQLVPMEKLRFPIGTIISTFIMMFATFFRKRYPVQPINDTCFAEWDLIILAGPTWSYNPSGPVLSLIDRDGKRLFNSMNVLPFISCRGYWRVHFWGLKRLLHKCGAEVLSPIVFSHPTPEPWRTVGVFLKLAGKSPEAGSSWFHRFYPKYGHSRKQVIEAEQLGEQLAAYLQRGKPLNDLHFDIPVLDDKNLDR